MTVRKDSSPREMFREDGERVEVASNFLGKITVKEIVVPGMGMEDDVTTRERLYRFEDGELHMYYANSYISVEVEDLRTVLEDR